MRELPMQLLGNVVLKQRSRQKYSILMTSYRIKCVRRLLSCLPSK